MSVEECPGGESDIWNETQLPNLSLSNEAISWLQCVCQESGPTSTRTHTRTRARLCTSLPKSWMLRASPLIKWWEQVRMSDVKTYYYYCQPSLNHAIFRRCANRAPAFSYQQVPLMLTDRTAADQKHLIPQIKTLSFQSHLSSRGREGEIGSLVA